MILIYLTYKLIEGQKRKKFNENKNQHPDFRFLKVLSSKNFTQKHACFLFY